MGVFLEGVGVITQACTLVIGLPALFLGLTGRRAAPWIVGSTIVATALVMWAKAATWWTWANDGWMVVPIAVVIVAAFGAAAAAGSMQADATARTPMAISTAVAAGIAGGVIAGWMWQPCVGTELGDILNHAESEPLSTSLRMVVYTAGALLPTILLAALPTAWPAASRMIEHERARTIGLAFGAVYVLTVLSSSYDDLIGELSRWSSA